MKQNRNILDNFKHGPQIFGIFTMELRDHETGEVVERYSDCNVVVNGHRNAIIKAIAGSVDGHITKIKIGDDVGEGVTLNGNPNLTFADANPDTIFRDAGSWIEDGFIDQMSITITNTTSNNITATVAAVTHDTITLVLTDTLVAEGPVTNVNITGTASPDNPEPPKESYTSSTMDVVFDAPYTLSVTYPDPLTATFSVTIIGADVLAGYPLENFKVITSAALHTNNTNLFSYKRFPQRSISELLDLAISWSITVADPSSLVCGVAPFSLPIRTVYSTTYVTSEDYSILGDATAAPFSIVLPSAVGILGRIFNIKKIDVSANVVTVDTTGSETIDGAANALLSVANDSITVQSDGANWVIL